MTVPVVPIRIDTIPAFALPARYTITMLGMIAGFKPDFRTNESESLLSYSYPDVPALPPSALLPASRDAHGFLLSKNSYVPSQAGAARVGGVEVLSLFPVRGTNIAAGAVEVGGMQQPGTDLVSDAFFFLSLHEEWSAEKRDRFDRFEVEESLLGKLGALSRPVVAEYAEALAACIRIAGVELPEHPRFEGRTSAVCLTHDIDYTTHFSPGIMYRESVRYLLLNELKRPFSTRLRRWSEYVGRFLAGIDAYAISMDTFLRLESDTRVRGTYFFKSGATGDFDVRYSLRSHAISKWLSSILRDDHEIGLHPSFHSYRSGDVLAQEKSNLEQVTGHAAVAVRQHYLKFRYPETWRLQISNGFQVDSTLGFASHEGFRNGCVHPFLPFDLEEHRVLPIWELPMHIMDGTLVSYRKLDAQDALGRLTEIFDTVRGKAGVCTLLFHNVLHDPFDYPGWARIFEKIIEMIVEEQTYSSTVTDTAQLWMKSSGYRSIPEIEENTQE